MYFTPRKAFVSDILFTLRTLAPEFSSPPVLIGHSAGGGCVQDLLSNPDMDVHVGGMVLLAAIPGYGSLGVNINWWKLDPWFFLRMLWHCGHPRSPLSSTELVRRAFFSRGMPEMEVKRVERTMAEWESMSWPMGMMARFVEPMKVLQKLAGSERGILVVAGEKDKLMGVEIERKLAAWYRQAGGKVSVDVEVSSGVGHHLMLDVNWKDGAEKVAAWLDG